MIGLLRIYIIISVAPSLKSWTRKPHRVHSLLPLLLFLVPHKSVIWPCHDLSLCIQSRGNLFASLLLSFLIYYCAFLWESATVPFQSSAQSYPSFPFHCSRWLNSVGENHVITLIMSHLSAAQQTPPNSSVSLLPHICNSSQLLLYLSLEIHSRLFPLLSWHLNI